MMKEKLNTTDYLKTMLYENTVISIFLRMNTYKSPYFKSVIRLIQAGLLSVSLLFLMPSLSWSQTVPPPAGPSTLACADSVLLATPCYINGNPLAGGDAATLSAFVVWNYNNSGDAGPIRTLPASQIGSTWGTAYKLQNKTLYTSAVMKRHVGFGSLGLGGIYKIDLTQPTLAAQPFVDLTALGLNVGTDTRTATSGVVDNPNELSASSNEPSWDVDAFAAVGKRSLGGLDVSPDGNTMWVMNLYQKQLVKLDISGATPTLVQTYPIANPGCSNNDYRPWAVKSFAGKVWVGITCTAETSQDTNDLKSYVVALDGGTFKPVYDFSLNYIKGQASGNGTGEGRRWYPWTDTVKSVSARYDFVVYPTPILTDIEFDIDGSMVLAFMDRTGNQVGYTNYRPIFNNTIDLISVHSGGDILRVCNVSGTYQLESNGTCPNELPRPIFADGSANTGANNGQGPGGGEYYWGETWQYAPWGPSLGYHTETSFGALAFKPGSGEMVLSVYDPTLSGISGGVIKLNNTTGRKDSDFRLYQNTGAFPTFAKAVGLGDLELFCANAPMTDLTLTKTVDSACVSQKGQQVTFTLKVKNVSTVNATGVTVKVVSGSGLTFVSANPSVSFDNSTGIWTIGAVNAGDSSILQISVKADSIGVNYCTAEISALDQVDINSTPNNGVITEDDIARSCVSVPISICTGQTYQATLANGLTGIQWYKNGVAIVGQTNQSLTIASYGDYTFTANEATCPVEGCCPIKVIAGGCTILCKPVICLPVAVVRQ